MKKIIVLLIGCMFLANCAGIVPSTWQRGDRTKAAFIAAMDTLTFGIYGNVYETARMLNEDRPKTTTNSTAEAEKEREREEMVGIR